MARTAACVWRRVAKRQNCSIRQIVLPHLAEEPGPIVEAFSQIRREHPDDGNRAISLVVERLRALGLPVTVHEPMLYLTLPKGAPACFVEKMRARCERGEWRIRISLPAGGAGP